MTEQSGTSHVVTRTKDFPTRILLPLDDEMVQRIAGVLRDGEPRVHLIREAVDREIRRREKAKPKESK